MLTRSSRLHFAFRHQANSYLLGAPPERFEWNTIRLNHNPNTAATIQGSCSYPAHISAVLKLVTLSKEQSCTQLEPAACFGCSLVSPLTAHERPACNSHDGTKCVHTLRNKIKSRKYDELFTLEPLETEPFSSAAGALELLWWLNSAVYECRG